MTRRSLLLGEAWLELRAGLRSGVVTLTFVGLVLYLLMVLTNAGYVQQMGGADVPRNAPSLVYMMSSGDAFFLFFAWAWVFAQPVVRDRQALLHEVVLTAPVSLRALLAGRFIGALAVGLLLGVSQMLGFLLAPLLEVAGLVPAGAVGPTPWRALAWAFLVFVLPTTTGTGALYYVAALRTRSTSGPFSVAAVLVLVWMFAMVIMSGGSTFAAWAAVLDPSCFADVDRLNRIWTPVEKASLLYPVTPPFLLNRLVWCVGPLMMLVGAVTRCTREHLVTERPEGPTAPVAPVRSVVRTGLLQGAAETSAAFVWSRALVAEARWQMAMLWGGRVIKATLLGMVLLGVSAGLVHGVNSADGPFEARPEVLGPLLNQSLYLLVAFIVAALVGAVVRRDEHAGIGEMLDAAPAPSLVVFLGRLVAVSALTLALLLTPAVSAMLLTALRSPAAFSPLTPLTYQVVVYGPGLLELVLVTMLLHYLIRRSGPAYAASMLATFILAVNHEAELITYPPFEFGIPAHVEFSVATGWSVWLERLAVGDLFKLCTIAVLATLAALVQIRGLDSRLAQGALVVRQRLVGPLGAVLGVALAGGTVSFAVMANQFTELGGYESRTTRLDRDAAWEHRWLPTAGAYAVGGGVLALDIDTRSQRVDGRWRLDQVTSTTGVLHLELPPHLALHRATVDGTPTSTDILDRHAAISLGSCKTDGCTVMLDFSVLPRGWNTEGQQPWLNTSGVWARARQVAPTLGLDRDQRILAPVERESRGLPAAAPEIERRALSSSSGIAPAGTWQLDVRVDDAAYVSTRLDGDLDFVVQHALRARPVVLGSYTIVADRTRADQAVAVADDARQMQACVARRLGPTPALFTIAQLPRGMGTSTAVNGTMLLAEAPHWDIAGRGIGRWRRQAEIGALLARQVLRASTGIRQGAGTRVFIEGVAGATGYLCVGDNSGTAALQALLSRGAERIARALGGAPNPVAETLHDTSDAWLSEYAAMASIPWVARTDSQQFQRILATIERDGEIDSALRAHVGTALASRILGMPLASDLGLRAAGFTTTVDVAKFIWSKGGWTPTNAASGVLLLEPEKQHLGVRGQPYTARVPWVDVLRSGTLLLDDWPAYERTPENNRKD